MSTQDLRPARAVTVVDADLRRFWSKVDVRSQDECWEWIGARHTQGYGVFSEHGGVSVRAHRVSAQLAGMDIVGRQVCHSCDNPPCVNPAHLFTGDARLNAQDAAKKGRTYRDGRRDHRGKFMRSLSDEHSTEIVERFAAGESVHSLATTFDVDVMTIRRTLERREQKEAVRHGELLSDPESPPLGSDTTPVLVGAEAARSDTAESIVR